MSKSALDAAFGLCADEPYTEDVRALRFVTSGAPPSYGSAGAAGIDLTASESATIRPGETRVVSTGLRVELPHGHVGLMRGRSGLAFNRNVWAFEGTIDEDYRGEVKVLLANLSDDDFHISAGDRIAQLVVVPVIRCGLARVDSLGDTSRGENGFGSTGIR